LGADQPDPVQQPPSVSHQRARRRLAAVRAWYEGSWAEDLVQQLKALDVGNWTLVFGAELLWSALPFIILVSSFANHRIDGDLSRHIGLDRQAARIVSGIFRNPPHPEALAIATGLLFSFAGVIAVVGSLQVLYERTFEQEQRGWRGLPRQLVWTAVLFAVLVADGFTDGPERRAVGGVVGTIVAFVVVAVFFAWTMHFLLAGRVHWRRVIRPALITAVLWILLSLFSSVYFSGVVVDDTRTFGTVGVVFTFLTWFVLIGGVIVGGAAIGGVWERRGSAPAKTSAERA
jgi:membrane protein